MINRPMKTRPMKTRCAFLLLLLAVTAPSGCAPGMAPRWGNPGTLMDQRNRAVVHDPYIDNNLGPAVDGVRPREFDKPLAEPERDRIYRDSPFFVPSRPLPQ